MKKIFKFLTLVLLVIPFLTGAKTTDGSTNGITITDPNVGSANYSFGCWLWDDSYAEDGSILNYGDATHGWDFHEFTTPSVYWQTEPGSSQAFEGVMTNSAWHHVMATFDGTTAKIYVDATDATADLSVTVTAGTTQSATNDFKLALTMTGDPFGSPQGSFKWAHCVYYDAVLTGAEIASIANKSTCENAIATHAANLQIFLKGISGSAVTDSSSNGFTVTTTGTLGDDAGPGSLPCDSAASTSSVAILKAIGAL